jgi:polyphosphate kinase
MYFNRELSWLKFNERVLAEANDESLPILERLKFAAIFSSNLDEFFMVRVASIHEQIKAGYSEEDESGYMPMEVFDAIYDEVNHMIHDQYKATKSCLHALDDEGVHVVRQKDFSDKLLKKMKNYFETDVFPVLTPMAVDFSRPFPFVRNKHLYIVCKLLVGEDYKLALVQVPSNYNRLIPFKVGDETQYVLLEELIMTFVDKLFTGYKVVDRSLFRLTRNGDLNFIEDDADDLLMVIEEAVKQRKWGDPIRLEISKKCDHWTLAQLKRIYGLQDNQVYYMPGIVDMTLWFSFDPKKKKHLKRLAYAPRKMPYMKTKNIFKTIGEKDIFLHHPYESFDFVVDFIKQASRDPKVLAIKQTLYRVSGDSAIVKALAEAADAGKQVTVLVELMARFDEENNIEWAKKLERRGVHVIYGVYGYKTHSKITLVVRKENRRIKRYVHLGTGNYNDKTARLYTDMGILTSKENLGADASLFFNMVFGFTNSVETQYMNISPYELRDKFYDLIDREINHVKKGHKGHVIAKMNSLVDRGIVDKLYEASQAGVKVELIVRGICVLVPGVEGLSDNISVKSIIGEFLEHSRIYYFKNGNQAQVFLSSADWMTRNLNRRIELMFPVQDDLIAKRIIETLKLYLADNIKSWLLTKKGKYSRSEVEDKEICAHDILKTITYEDDEEFMKALKERM